MKKDAERLEWIANDYLHLAQAADGKARLIEIPENACSRRRFDGGYLP
jgi:hypothetical protein